MKNARDAASRGVFGDMASLLRHLPHYQEPATLILLKGHLLVEELLRGYIDRTLPNPSAFQHARFTFANVLILCHALTPSSAKYWAFDAAKKLNDIRNEIAHELESSSVEIKLEAFVTFIEQHAKNSVFPPKERGEARLYMAIADLHNELTKILHIKDRPIPQSSGRSEARR